MRPRRLEGGRGRRWAGNTSPLLFFGSSVLMALAVPRVSLSKTSVLVPCAHLHAATNSPASSDSPLTTPKAAAVPQSNAAKSCSHTAPRPDFTPSRAEPSHR